MRKILIEYVRDHKGRKVGCVVAIPTDDGFSIGWSKYNTTLEHRPFNKKFALNIAIGRAEKGSLDTSKQQIPSCVKPYLSKMKARASRYFKHHHIHTLDESKKVTCYERSVSVVQPDGSVKSTVIGNILDRLHKWID